MANDIKVGDYVMVIENEDAIGFPAGSVKKVLKILDNYWYQLGPTNYALKGEVGLLYVSNTSLFNH